MKVSDAPEAVARPGSLVDGECDSLPPHRFPGHIDDRGEGDAELSSIAGCSAGKQRSRHSHPAAHRGRADPLRYAVQGPRESGSAAGAALSSAVYPPTQRPSVCHRFLETAPRPLAASAEDTGTRARGTHIAAAPRTSSISRSRSADGARGSGRIVLDMKGASMKVRGAAALVALAAAAPLANAHISFKLPSIPGVSPGNAGGYGAPRGCQQHARIALLTLLVGLWSNCRNRQN